MLDFDFADVKPSVVNWVIVGVMAITFIVFAKYLFLRVIPIEGVTQFVEAI